ncbi:MAG: envelope stress response membrane protein PspB [Acidocella sp.]|nr:envelope stress response membrane protein PspB [Acidocella sp.]
MSDNMTAVLIVAISVLPWAFIPMIRSWRRPAAALTTEELGALHQMAQTASRLEQRVVSLEQILDAEVPGWRRNAPDMSGARGDFI